MAALLTASVPAGRAEERLRRLQELLLDPFLKVNSVGADIRICSPGSGLAQAGFTFYAHKDRLGRASTFFHDMFEVCDAGASSSPPSDENIPTIIVEESTVTFAYIIGILYETQGIQCALLRTTFEMQSQIWHGGIKYDSAVVTALAEQAMQ